MWDLPQICKRIVDNRVTIAALLTILCHGYLETMWSPPADILRTGQNFLKFSRAVHTRSQIFEHFVTLFGTFSSCKMGCPWSGGKWDSTWLALLTWSLAKTFAASRSSEWSLTIQYYIYIQMVCLGHMHWWSLLSSHRSSLVYWHMPLHWIEIYFCTQPKAAVSRFHFPKWMNFRRKNSKTVKSFRINKCSKINLKIR